MPLVAIVSMRPVFGGMVAWGEARASMVDSRKDYWTEFPLWLKVIVVAVAYLAAAELGNALSVQNQFSTFWPPAGVLLVLLVLIEPREWPILLLAAGAANVSSDLIHDRALLVALGFAAANCSEAVLGAYLLRRLNEAPVVLDTRRKVLGFGLATLAAPVLGAAIGTSVVSIAYGAASWERAWLTWWSGDALGILSIGAFGLALADLHRRRRSGAGTRITTARALRLVMLLALTAAAGWWLIANYGPLAGWKAVTFLPVLIAASSFGQVGSSSVGFVLTLAMAAGFAERWSKTAVVTGSESLEVIALQAFLAVLILAGIYVTAAIEEARSAEEAAHVAAEKYRVVLETLPVGVTVSDETGAIIESSLHAEEILGVATGKHRQRDIQAEDWQVLRPDGSEKPTDEWTSVRALSGQVLTRDQEGVRRPDGSIVWLDVSAAPIPVAGYGVAITYQDITQEVAARDLLLTSERHLQQARDHLEVEVAERTAELVTTNEELLEASRVKSRLLANMSHELRTPLNSIIGFSDLLAKGMAGPLTDEQRKQIGMINTSGKDLLGLVNDVLDLERMESGHEVVTPALFGLCDLVTDVIEELDPQSVKRGVQLLVQPPDVTLELTSDRAKVKQVLVNLISNAVKFTDVGSVTVRCVADGEGVLITVTDTGVGIHAEEIDHIMDDFHQVDRADGLKPAGTGLGLPISKRLTEMLGGRLWVESEFGRGSSFQVWLPDLALQGV